MINNKVFYLDDEVNNQFFNSVDTLGKKPAKSSILAKFLFRRCRDFKLVATRMNSLSGNVFYRFFIGVLASFMVLNPIFWIFGIKGVQFLIKSIEVAAKVCKAIFFAPIILTTLLIFSIRDMVKIVKQMWVFFIVLALLALVSFNAVITRNSWFKPGSYGTKFAVAENVSKETVTEEPESNLFVPVDNKSKLEESDVIKIVYTDFNELGENNYHYYPQGDYEKLITLMTGVVKNRVESELFPNTVEDVLEQPGQFEGVLEEMKNSPKYDVQNKHIREIVLNSLNDTTSYPADMYWEYSFSFESKDPDAIPSQEFYDSCIAFLKEEVSGPSSYEVYHSITAAKKLDNGYYQKRVIFFMANPKGFS